MTRGRQPRKRVSKWRSSSLFVVTTINITIITPIGGDIIIIIIITITTTTIVIDCRLQI
jgi:hypothetical protein